MGNFQFSGYNWGADPSNKQNIPGASPSPGKMQVPNLAGAGQDPTGSNQVPYGGPSRISDVQPSTAYQPQAAQAPQYNPFGSLDQTTPGMGEQYANSALSYYGANGMPGRSSQAYDSFMGSTPADMSPYYDNAVNHAQNDINTQLAARGMYGSSAGVGQIANATTNLRAQEAKDNAQYGLSRAQLGGSLASTADQNQLAWTSGLGDLAFRGQTGQMQRGQNVFNDQMMMSGQLAGMEGNAYDQMFNSDQQNLDNTMSALGVNAGNNLSQSTSDANAQANRQAQANKDMDAFYMEMAKMGMMAAL